MLNVAILGFGVIGRVHMQSCLTCDDIQIVAICDVDKEKLGNALVLPGNIEMKTDKNFNISDVALYSDFDEMLAQTEIDALIITLPTYLHKEFAIKAIHAGLHVLCEKPMALNLQDCDEMIVAAKNSGKVLQIGHCIRFWPEYDKAREIIDSGKYGKVKAASFRRLSALPKWAWENWLMDAPKSGGMALDLHIHDSDFIQHLFGMPTSVRSFGAKGTTGDYDHILTNYIYEDDKVITAEGSWMMTDSFSFEMSFVVILEKASITFSLKDESVLRIYPSNGDAFTPEVDKGNGYTSEIAHFIMRVRGEKVPEMITLQQSRNSVRLVDAEKKSAQGGQEVKLK